MTLEQRLDQLIGGIGADIKALNTRQGNLSGLNTNAKNNLVAAVNELKTLVDNLSGSTALIDDSAGAGTLDKTYSVGKILTLIAQARADLLGGVGAAYDTLQELATALTGQDTAIGNLLTSVGNRVRFDAAQSLTAQQQAQARSNIAAVGTAETGNLDADLLALYNAAKA